MYSLIKEYVSKDSSRCGIVLTGQVLQVSFIHITGSNVLKILLLGKSTVNKPYQYLR